MAILRHLFYLLRTDLKTGTVLRYVLYLVCRAIDSVPPLVRTRRFLELAGPLLSRFAFSLSALPRIRTWNLVHQIGVEVTVTKHFGGLPRKATTANSTRLYH